MIRRAASDFSQTVARGPLYDGLTFAHVSDGGGPSMIVADGSTHWYDDGRIGTVATVVGVIATIVIGSLQLREARRANASQRQSHALGYVIAALLVVVGIVLFNRKPTESTSTPAASAACPSRADFQSAPDSFKIVEMPPDRTAMVLQFVARQDIGKRQIVVSICRDTSSGYWYFSHYRDDGTTGLVTSAKRTDDGFTAANGPTIYQYSADGGTAQGGGVDLRLVFVDILCAEQDDIAGTIVKAASDPCTENTIEAWAPRS